MTGEAALPGPLYVAALTARGAATAAKLSERLGAEAFYLPSRLASRFPGSTAFDRPFDALLAELWPKAGGFLLVMAAGIAVRTAAPLLQSKKTDPAVVVFDPDGRFAVPLLSGHLGGANLLAAAAAEALGGQAVITTATDAAGAPAMEVWARDNGLRIENPGLVARVNSALADGEPVGLYLDGEVSGLDELLPHLALFTREPEKLARFAGARVAVTHRWPVPPNVLALRPAVLVLGVGSKKGADPDGLAAGVLKALHGAGLSEFSAAAVATAGLKASEPAINALAARLGVGLKTYGAAELASVEVPNPSERVLAKVGTPAVAEASAILASGCGKLILEKTAGGDWTLAVAMKNREQYQ